MDMRKDYRSDFPLIVNSSIAYLDNAATAQRPQCVIDAESDFYLRHNANPMRGLYELSIEATDIYENARETVRKFIGAASTEEVVFTRNTTESLNLVAYSYGLTHVKAVDFGIVALADEAALTHGKRRLVDERVADALRHVGERVELVVQLVQPARRERRKLGFDLREDRKSVV